VAAFGKFRKKINACGVELLFPCQKEIMGKIALQKKYYAHPEPVACCANGLPKEGIGMHAAAIAIDHAKF